MHELMMLHMVTGMMCCHYPYMFPQQPLFRPWGTMGYPGITIHGTRYIDPILWPPAAAKKKRRRKKPVECSAWDLLCFACGSWLDDYAIEFQDGMEWHILEVEKKHGVYALDGDVYGSYGEMEKAFLQRFPTSQRLEVLKYTVPVNSVLGQALRAIWGYMKYFLLSE